MFNHKIILVVNLFVLFCKSSSKISPEYIQPCPGLKSDCLIRNFQETIPHFVKGIPSLGIVSVDPLQQGSNKIDLELPGGLKVQMANGTVSGFKKCIVEEFKFEGMSADLMLRCNLTVKSKYKANGRILIFAINGDGDAKIKTPNIVFKGKIQFEDKTRDGIVYREIKSYKITYNYGDKVSFVFTNLFNGNPELSHTVLAFLNENWKQVVDEFGKPIVDAIIHITFGIIKKFLSVVPRAELFV